MADRKAGLAVHQAEIDALDPRYVREATGVVGPQQESLGKPADKAVPDVARDLQDKGRE